MSSIGWRWWRGLGLLHVALFALAFGQVWRDRPATQARFRPEGDVDLTQLSVEVARWLPELVPSVGPDEALTVVNGLPQVFPFELHTIPRSTVFLQRFDPEFLKLAKLSPRHQRLGRERYERLEETKRRFTVERFHDALSRSQYLLTFLAGSLEAVAAPYRLQLVEERTNPQGRRIALFRVTAPAAKSR